MASVTFDSPGFSREKRKPRTLSTRSFPRLSPRLRQTLRVAGVLFAAAVLMEFGLRLMEVLDGGSSAAGARIAAAKFAPSREFGGRTVNDQGYWDDAFTPGAPLPGAFRVALVGGEATLGGDTRTNFAAQLERLVPGLQIDHFGLPGLTPADWSAQFATDIAPRRPRLVLICLSADDVVAAPVAPHWLESRTLDWAGRLLAAVPTGMGELSPADGDFESFVRRRAAAIEACLIDNDTGSDRRRRDAQQALARLVERCRSQDVGVGLVLLPGEYQLAPNLAESYCRNLGLDAARIDIELPQRRWLAYADKLEVASVDLLPAFRGAGARVYEPGSIRWTNQGQTVAAETISRWLAGAYGDAIAAK